MNTKIMVLSDIHGKAPALKKVLDIYKKGKFNQIFILGDVLYHGPRNPLPEGYNPAEVVELLNPLKQEILAIRGNCDSEVDQMLLQFPIMADSAQFMNEKRRFVLTHGHLDASRILPPLPAEIRLSGHTHLPVLEMKEGVCYLNPGSISLPKDGFLPSYGVIDGDDFSVCLLDSGDRLLSLTLES